MVAQSASERREHSCVDIEALFAECFAASDNTRLEGGGAEPLYLPAGADCAHHRILYRGDYFASALHEIAHWCIAGPARRQWVDYGYWYHPGERGPAEQLVFEVAEAAPQALEWVFANAAGHPFRISRDNLGDASADAGHFKRCVLTEAWRYCHQGVPPRAARFIAALVDRYGTEPLLVAARYSMTAI